MLRRSGNPRRLSILLLLLLLTMTMAMSSAQTPEAPKKDDPDRRQAYELYDQGKFVDAMPLFEKLVADHPSDMAVREAWAVSDPQKCSWYLALLCFEQ